MKKALSWRVVQKHIAQGGVWAQSAVNPAPPPGILWLRPASCLRKQANWVNFFQPGIALFIAGRQF